jgi:hypothetical protein
MARQDGVRKWLFLNVVASGSTSFSSPAGGCANLQKRPSTTVAKQTEQNRRRELERGFNGIEDNREVRIRTIKELGRAYLDDYRVRHKGVVFAEYAVGNVIRHLGAVMAVDVSEQTVTAYQTTRLKEEAAPKTINEDVVSSSDCSGKLETSSARGFAAET